MGARDTTFAVDYYDIPFNHDVSMDVTVVTGWLKPWTSCLRQRTELCKLPAQDKLTLTVSVVGGKLKFSRFLGRWVIVDVLILLIVSTPYQICTKGSLFMIRLNISLLVFSVPSNFILRSVLSWQPEKPSCNNPERSFKTVWHWRVANVTLTCLNREVQTALKGAIHRRVLRGRCGAGAVDLSAISLLIDI